MRKIIISIFVLILGIIIVHITLENCKYNKELDIGPFDKLYIYHFEIGKGFLESKVTHSQKEAIINYIRELKPSKEAEQYEYKKVGGYYAFYFKRNNIKTVFSLIKVDENLLFVSVSKINTEGKVINQYYFTSSLETAQKIENVIIIE